MKTEWDYTPLALFIFSSIIELRVTNPEPQMSELRTRYSEQSIEFRVMSPEPQLSTIMGVGVL
ncbi:hypothetical protein BDR05DRAFT_1002945 [Suillus weaverae]|nr:hypothetical protein BDR05DRAFT_1002945 [Suillus weaverae]